MQTALLLHFGRIIVTVVLFIWLNALVLLAVIEQIELYCNVHVY